MLQLLSFSSLLCLALSACSLPPPSTAVPWPNVPVIETTLPGGIITYACPPEFYGVGNFGVGGPLAVHNLLTLTCNPAVGKIMSTPTMESMLTTMIYAQPPVKTMCALILRPEGVGYTVPDGVANFKCGPGYRTELLPGMEIDSLNCTAGEFYAKMLDGTDMLVGTAPLECIKGTTTAAPTTTTTTTVKPDAPASAGQLWNVNYYYNYGYGVHAFCADSTCINAIQSNGIGYDMNNGWGLMSRAVSESMINSVRASCPTGSKHLRNLGFTKSGNKYLHNFSGSGLKQGWVSIASGACGAKVVIKRWKSRYTDDMMYGVNLEWNTWYQGMVQDGGMAHFYMWE